MAHRQAPVAGAGAHHGGTRAAILSYAELFGDPSGNPFEEPHGEAYQNIYETTWRTFNQAPSVLNVHRDILVDFQSPIGSVGVFVRSNDSVTGTLEILHGFRTHPGQPGRHDPDRFATFAFAEDVLGIDVLTIPFDESVLAITDTINIAATPVLYHQLLNREPTAQLMGPFEDAEPGIKQSRTRGAMFIPYQFTGLVVGQHLTARQAWEVLAPAIEAAGMLDQCAELLDFLIIAGTLRKGESEPMTLHDRVGLADRQITPAVANHRRNNVLYKQLPDLVPQMTQRTSDPAVTRVADGLDHLVADMRRDRVDQEQRRTEAAAPKTVRTRYGEEEADLLLRLTHTSDDDDLPRLYHELAGRTKASLERLVIQRDVDRSAAALGLASPRVSPSQALALRTWCFEGDYYYDIGHGILPFSVTPPDAVSKGALKMLAEDRRRAEIFDVSADSPQGINPGDAGKLRNPKGYVPVLWPEARSQLKSTLPILASVLGIEHVVVVAYRRMLTKFDRMETRLQVAFERSPNEKAGPPLFVFHIQLMLFHWFRDQKDVEMTTSLEAPDFCAGLRTLETTNSLNWIPAVDDVEHLAHLTKAPTPVDTRNRTTNPPAGGRGTGGGRTEGGGTTAAAGSGGTPSREAGRRVQNPTRDSRLVGNTPLATNVRTRRVAAAIELAGGTPVAVMRNGVECERCISYHAKGTCYDNCDRKADHAVMPADETESFYGWCQRAFA
jgi:hypothetical protein